MPRILDRDPFMHALVGFTLPIGSLLIAIVIVLAISLIRRGSGAALGAARADADAVEASVAVAHRAERIVLAAGAIFVTAVFMFEWIMRAAVLNLANVVEWWAYATPIAAAVITISAALVVLVRRRTPHARRPALSTTPRTWRSFSSLRDLTIATIAFVALLVTTLAAGFASTADDEGRFIHLDIALPNTGLDPIRPWFYGWSYGVPVLLCLGPLVALTLAALAANAARPYVAADSVAAERRARSATATSITWIASGAMLLALGGAWRFISRAAVPELRLVDESGAETSYVTATAWDGLATALHWGAPLAEICGFALLLLAASQLADRWVVAPGGTIDSSFGAAVSDGAPVTERAQ
jgi:hypothetical protein